MGFAAVTLGVHHHGDHEADNDHDGVPGGADEPDGLVEHGEAAARQLVGQPLDWAGLITFFDGFKPASPVESLCMWK